MEFTYRAYENLIDKIRTKGYQICNYYNYMNSEKCVILRHDVDNNLESALRFATMEQRLDVSSTYFILLSSDFYNIASKSSLNIIYRMKMLGHDIGLHFDEVAYEDRTDCNVLSCINREVKIMSDIVGFDVTSISMHRPSQYTLQQNYSIPGVINSYSSLFFEEFKYLSDSRRYWHEPISDVLESGVYNCLHILTHPFWYSETGVNAEEAIKTFVNSANMRRYNQLKENIRDLDEFMLKDDVT